MKPRLPIVDMTVPAKKNEPGKSNRSSSPVKPATVKLDFISRRR